MKKQLLFPLLVAFSLLLCAFTVSPAPGSDEKPSMNVEMTTVIASDGSGTLEYKVTLSKEMMALLKSTPGFEETGMCDSLFQYAYSGWEQSEKNVDGALSCSAENKFADLVELKSLIESDFSGSSFERLEIKSGTLYYDLAPNISGSDYSSEYGTDLPFDISATWILKVPGDVVSTNADKTSGQTLTWDLMSLTTSSHIRAECKLGGGAFGSDSTLIVVGVILLMGCCCVVVLIAGGAAFFFLRRKKAPAAEA